MGLSKGALMNDTVAVVLIWLTASALLVAGLGLVNLFSEFRRFRSEGIPRPWFVIGRRVRGVLLPNSFACVSQGVDNRTAWLSWDFRWVTAGQTVVQIVKFNPETRELYLQLANPIVLIPS